MAQQSSGELLEALFTRLNLQLKNQQNKKALKTVDESTTLHLKLSPTLCRVALLFNCGNN
jgi:hypothetical protein